MVNSKIKLEQTRVAPVIFGISKSFFQTKDATIFNLTMGDESHLPILDFFTFVGELTFRVKRHTFGESQTLGLECWRRTRSEEILIQKPSKIIHHC